MKKFYFAVRKKNLKKFFFAWKEPSIRYAKIPYQPNMRLYDSYFMSYKYFEHQREKILELFSLKDKDQRYIKKKYRHIWQYPKTVGVHIRSQRVPQGFSSKHFSFGKDFYTKAIDLFDKDCLFVVTSNRLKYAKSCIPDHVKNVIFIEGEDLHIDLYILSLCKHNIIANSTFGWWAAWLNQNPNKKIVRPLPDESNRKDYYPPDWIVVDSDYSIDKKDIIEAF